MNFKHAIAAAAMAVLASSSFATTHNYISTALTGSDQVVDSFLATGGFSSSFTFYNSTNIAAWITDGSTTYQYLNTGSGVLNFGFTNVSYDNVALGGSLPNANWTVHVQGTGGVFVGGSTFNVGSVVPTIPAPVPEPETYAMLLAGLGAIGFMSRRRKADVQA